MGLEDVTDMLASKDIAPGFGKLRDVDLAAVGAQVIGDAAGAGQQDSCHHVQQGRLTRSAASHQCNLLPGAEAEEIDIDGRYRHTIRSDIRLAKLVEVQGHVYPQFKHV